jgi:hypothetical protein
LLQCALVDVLDLCSNRFEKALLLNSNNDAKPMTVCTQEGENGVECLHIKFTLVEMYLSRGRLKNKERMLNTCLSRGRLKCKKGRMMRTSQTWIHPQ